MLNRLLSFPVVSLVFAPLLPGPWNKVLRLSRLLGCFFRKRIWKELRGREREGDWGGGGSQKKGESREKEREDKRNNRS